MSTRSLAQVAPETWTAFADLQHGAVVDGVPSEMVKELMASEMVKELMALAIATVEQCDGCIAYHAKAAARRGATA